MPATKNELSTADKIQRLIFGDERDQIDEWYDHEVRKEEAKLAKRCQKAIDRCRKRIKELDKERQKRIKEYYRQ